MMKSENKTKEQLLKEIKLLKAKIGKLEKTEIRQKRMEEARWKSIAENSPDHVLLLNNNLINNCSTTIIH